jgi:hypothetical protein
MPRTRPRCRVAPWVTHARSEWHGAQVATNVAAGRTTSKPARSAGLPGGLSCVEPGAVGHDGLQIAPIRAIARLVATFVPTSGCISGKGRPGRRPRRERDGSMNTSCWHHPRDECRSGPRYKRLRAWEPPVGRGGARFRAWSTARSRRRASIPRIARLVATFVRGSERGPGAGTGLGPGLGGHRWHRRRRGRPDASLC